MSEAKKDRSFSKFASQSIKGVAIILMMLHHCFLAPERWEGYTVSFAPFTEKQVVDLANFGKICVAMFVFISAFGITKSCMKITADSDNKQKESSYQKSTVIRLFKLLWGFWGSFAVWQIFSALNYRFAFTENTHNYLTVYGKGPESVLYFITDAFGLSELFKTPTFNGTWWYMSLAIIIILIMPLLYELYKRFGIVVVILAPLLPQFLGVEKNNLTRYLFMLMLGIWCADKNILEKLCNLKIVKNDKLSTALKFIISTAVLVLVFILRQYDGKLLSEYIEVMDSVIPLFVIYYFYNFIIFIPVIKQMLQFIGKHATTIFMTHTFIRAYYFQDFIYSFRNWALITLMLLITSLAYAFVYDSAIKLIGYNKLCDSLISGIEKRLKIKCRKAEY